MSEDQLEALSESLLELHEALDFYGHDTDEYDIDAIEEVESLIQSQAMELKALRAENARLREAVKRAEQFIVNGSEFGFIRMPEDREGEIRDPALNCLDFLRQALKAGEAS